MPQAAQTYDVLEQNEEKLTEELNKVAKKISTAALIRVLEFANHLNSGIWGKGKNKIVSPDEIETLRKYRASNRPTERPYEHRRDGEIIEFLRTKYADWMDGNFTMAELRACDNRALTAFNNYKRNNPVPEDIVLPTMAEWHEHRIEIGVHRIIQSIHPKDRTKAEQDELNALKKFAREQKIKLDEVHIQPM